MAKVPEYIYRISYAGKITRLNVKTITPLPDGKNCYDIQDYGYIIFKKDNTYKIDNTLLCLGVSGLRHAVRNRLTTQLQQWEANILKYEKCLMEEKEKIDKFNKNRAEMEKFIQDEHSTMIAFQKALANR